MSNAIMNILVWFYLNIGFQFFKYIPRSGIAVSYEDSVFNWLSNHQLFCTIPSPYYICTSGICGFLFVHILTNTYYYLSFCMKLKLQSFGHLVQRQDSLEKTLMLGKIEGRKRRGWQRMRGLEASLTRWTWIWANSGGWWGTRKPDVL